AVRGGGPLPHVAVHVAQPQFIRRVRANSRGSSEGLSLRRLAEWVIAGEVGLIGGEGVARLVEVGMERTLCFSSCRSAATIVPSPSPPPRRSHTNRPALFHSPS